MKTLKSFSLRKNQSIAENIDEKTVFYICKRVLIEEIRRTRR
jgi:hypothetical protein